MHGNNSVTLLFSMKFRFQLSWKKAEKIAVFKMDSIHLLLVCILNIVAYLGFMLTLKILRFSIKYSCCKHTKKFTILWRTKIFQRIWQTLKCYHALEHLHPIAQRLEFSKEVSNIPYFKALKTCRLSKSDFHFFT